MLSEATTSPTYDAILRSVIDIVDEHGEAAVRIDDIVRATGVSTASIYRFFTSREGLIAAAQADRYARRLSSFADGIKPLLDKITTKEEFRDFVVAAHRQTFVAESSALRLSRLNAIGSAMGRPVLTEQIASIQEGIVSRYAEMFRGPQEQGWIRPDADLKALSAWMMGHQLSRVLIELGGSSVDEQEWNRISEIAILATFFDDSPAAISL